MSKLPALVTSVLLVSLSLVACGGDKEAAPGGETPGAGPAGSTVTIDLWHSESAANLDTLERLISQYNSSQDEVKVRSSYQGNNEELMAKLTASLGSGQVPALALLVEADTQKMIDSGDVAPIQDFVDREDYNLSDLNETLVKFYTAEDKLWMMPLSGGVPLLYYNKVAFREVGLDPEKPPQNLEEVRQYSEKLLKRDASGNVVRSGIALDIMEWQERMVAEHDELLVDNNNGHDGRATKVLFDNDTERWFFQWWHDMVDEGLAFNVGRNPTYADGLLALASGRAAMTFSFSNALSSVIDALEKGVQGLEIGVSGLPGVPGGTGHPLLIERGLVIFNLQPEEEQEAAWKFIKWLMEPEQQAEWYFGSGYLPVNSKAFELPAAREMEAKYPQFKIAGDLYRAASVSPAPPGPLLGPQLDVAEIIRRAVEEMLVGNKDPIDAINDAAKDANELLEDYNRRVE